jgi:phospholipid/cholesterol/gamma-HCH transport system ATP-binding protein
MERGHAILELVNAIPQMSRAHVSLRLMAGEFALVQCRDFAIAANFVDFCCGLWPLQEGTVRFLGREWGQFSLLQAEALRGRIGRVFHEGGWINFLDVETNILLPQLHHTRRTLSDLRAAAANLAHDFGLPGVPTGRTSALSAADLARAACVRAFLGEPSMVVLENPVRGQYSDLAAPLLNAILRVCDRGAAVLWLTPGDVVWSDPSTPATTRLRLSELGLTHVRAST